ncbi:VOC family protein [Paenibacillus sp. N1-5-1-14]|uniref:VOC family protein n=1 Tax=Paenibacillus radicibacter TaxID=2972488 RepID=UPI0021597786|nr:VOC family protein [Paenibacillus radicibacter]MCR8643496.1 VOC family protein [Paenibacillus radicibacter]
MQFHHASIEVSDLDRSIAFYKEILGFIVETQLVAMGERIAFLTLEEFRLELVQPLIDETIQHRSSHLAFRIQDLREHIDLLRDQHITPVEGPYDLENGWRIAFYEGPDGEKLEFVELC